MMFSHGTVSKMVKVDASRRRVAACLDAFFQLENYLEDIPATRADYIKCRRKPVKEIFAELGPGLTRRAYQMTEASFWVLLEPFIEGSSETNDAESSNERHRNGAKNGLITAETRLSVALRYFAGGRPEDIMLVHGISFVEVYKSVWIVADAVNSCPPLAFNFPADHEQRRAIARGLHSKSKADFDCCAGAVDCLLVWIEKPEEACCALMLA